jgi:hypothetical protein
VYGIAPTGLLSDVISGIVENRIAVSPLEMRVSAQ